MFELAESDVTIIANAVAAIFDIISTALSIAIIYMVVVGRALRRDERLFFRVGSFLLACMVTLAVTHILIQQSRLLAATVFLLAAGLGCLTIYWIAVRSVNRTDDMRIPYTMMIWGALWLFAIGALILIWMGRSRLKLEADVKLSLDIIAQIASIAITATGIVFAYIMKSDQANRTAKQQIYQTLELQSIELFRFEADQGDLVRNLWLEKIPPIDEKDRYQVKQYVCQMLNLFEMAFRFRVQQIMAPDVFGSWVIWIWELCSNPVFKKLWLDKNEDLPLNYIPDFRAAIALGIETSEKEETSEGIKLDDRARREFFFKELGDILGCGELKKWLGSEKAEAV